MDTTFIVNSMVNSIPYFYLDAKKRTPYLAVGQEGELDRRRSLQTNADVSLSFHIHAMTPRQESFRPVKKLDINFFTTFCQTWLKMFAMYVKYILKITQKTKMKKIIPKRRIKIYAESQMSHKLADLGSFAFDKTSSPGSYFFPLTIIGPGRLIEASTRSHTYPKQFTGINCL